MYACVGLFVSLVVLMSLLSFVVLWCLVWFVFVCVLLLLCSCVCLVCAVVVFVRVACGLRFVWSFHVLVGFVLIGLLLCHAVWFGLFGLLCAVAGVSLFMCFMLCVLFVSFRVV